MDTMDDELLNPDCILYRNISILVNDYPPSVEFKRLFKKGMFLLPNKSGFFEVVNFLNGIINKTVWQPLISWPVCNKKDEMKFRTAVRMFTSKLNSVHDLAVVPMLAPSVILAPGGYSVSVFLWKLSDYALTKVLEDNHGLIISQKVQVDPRLMKLKQGNLTTMVHAISMKNVEKAVGNQVAHNRCVKNGYQKARTMEKELARLKTEIETANLELQDIGNNLLIDSRLNDKLQNKKLETGSLFQSCLPMQDWNNKLGENIRELESCVSDLSLLEQPVNECYKLAKEIVRPSKAASLDGQQLMMSFPCANEKVIKKFYENEVLNLENLFYVSTGLVKKLLMVKGITAPFNIKRDLLPYIPTLKDMESNMSSCCEDSVGLEKAMDAQKEQFKRALEEAERVDEELKEQKDLKIGFVPQAILDYQASPVLTFNKEADCPAIPRLNTPKEQDPKRMFNWVKEKLFEKMSHESTMQVTPKKSQPLTPKRYDENKCKSLRDRKFSGFSSPSSLQKVDASNNSRKGTQTPKKKDVNMYKFLRSKNIPGLTKESSDKYKQKTVNSRIPTLKGHPPVYSQEKETISSTAMTPTKKKQVLPFTDEHMDNFEGYNEIVLPNDLSTSTASGSPCSLRDTWGMSDFPSLMSTVDGSLVGARTSTPFHLDQSSSHPAAPRPPSPAHYSPSGIFRMQFEEKKEISKGEGRKVRPSLEKLIMRFNALKIKTEKNIPIEQEHEFDGDTNDIPPDNLFN